MARFDHRTSRAGDPQLHAHLLFCNRVRCADGQWRTLDGRLIYDWLMPASLYANAVLKAEISARLGWSWDRAGSNLTAEVSGMPQELVGLWSKRSAELAPEARRRIRRFEDRFDREPTVTERHKIFGDAAAASRAAKGLAALGGDEQLRWADEAVSVGVDGASLISGLAAAVRVAPDRFDRPEVMVTVDGSGRTGFVDDPALLAHVVATAEAAATGLRDSDIDKVVYAAITSHADLADRAGDGPVEAVVGGCGAALRQHLVSELVQVGDRWYSPGLVSAEIAATAWLTAAHTQPHRGDEAPDDTDPSPDPSPGDGTGDDVGGGGAGSGRVGQDHDVGGGDRGGGGRSGVGGGTDGGGGGDVGPSIGGDRGYGSQAGGGVAADGGAGGRFGDC